MKFRSFIAGILAIFSFGCGKQASTDGLPPAEAIRVQLEALQKRKGDAFLTIQEVEGDAMVQIANGDKKLSLNIAYFPSKEDPATALKEAEIAVPATWVQTDFEAETYVQYDIPAEEAKDLPLFIDNLFKKFFKRPADYKIQCYIEKF